MGPAVGDGAPDVGRPPCGVRDARDTKEGEAGPAGSGWAAKAKLGWA